MPSVYAASSFLFLGLFTGCVGDAPVQSGQDSGGPDSTTADTGADVAADVSAADSGADVKAEAEAPCVDAGAPVAVGAISGVQCQADGGAAYCSQGISECCVDTAVGTFKCVAKVGGCGTQLPFECDKNSDCADAGVCCLKTPTKSTACPGRVSASGGTYCRVACAASEIQLCNGTPLSCLGTCTTLQLLDAPGKVLSGCL